VLCAELNRMSEVSSRCPVQRIKTNECGVSRILCAELNIMKGYLLGAVLIAE
jgi:hypothetical protein